MKNKTSLKWLITVLVVVFTAFAQTGNAQVIVRTLPDGTVIYSDGTIQRPGDVRTSRDRRTTRLPDGTVRYPDGRVKYPDGTVRYPDGRVKRPDGTILNPDGSVWDRNSRNQRDGQWIPPGQAKKKYGSKSARDYAPGHNKNKNKKHDRDDDDDDDDRNKEWKKDKKDKKDKEWKNKGKGKNK